MYLNVFVILCIPILFSLLPFSGFILNLQTDCTVIALLFCCSKYRDLNYFAIIFIYGLTYDLIYGSTIGTHAFALSCVYYFFYKSYGYYINGTGLKFGIIIMLLAIYRVVVLFFNASYEIDNIIYSSSSMLVCAFFLYYSEGLNLTNKYKYKT